MCVFFLMMLTSDIPGDNNLSCETRDLQSVECLWNVGKDTHLGNKSPTAYHLLGRYNEIILLDVAIICSTEAKKCCEGLIPGSAKRLAWKFSRVPQPFRSHLKRISPRRSASGSAPQLLCCHTWSCLFTVSVYDTPPLKANPLRVPLFFACVCTCLPVCVHLVL